MRLLTLLLFAALCALTFKLMFDALVSVALMSGYSFLPITRSKLLLTGHAHLWAFKYAAISTCVLFTAAYWVSRK